MERKVQKLIVPVLFSAVAIANANDIPAGPDDEHREIVETVSHPDYCKDKHGKPIAGNDCIKKSVHEIHGDSRKSASESIAEGISENLEKKRKPVTEKVKKEDSIVKQQQQ